MSVYNNLGLDKAANDTAAGFVRGKIAEIVNDPETVRLLQPDSYPIGTKRICIDTDYFATFNRPNVTLVDIRSNPIEEILYDAVGMADGTQVAGDAPVLTTVLGSAQFSPSEEVLSRIAFSWKVLLAAGRYTTDGMSHRPKRAEYATLWFTTTG